MVSYLTLFLQADFFPVFSFEKTNNFNFAIVGNVIWKVHGQDQRLMVLLLLTLDIYSALCKR